MIKTAHSVGGREIKTYLELEINFLLACMMGIYCYSNGDVI